MLITAVCVLFLIKLLWPKNKSGRKSFESLRAVAWEDLHRDPNLFEAKLQCFGGFASAVSFRCCGFQYRVSNIYIWDIWSEVRSSVHRNFDRSTIKVEKCDTVIFIQACLYKFFIDLCQIVHPGVVFISKEL